MFATHRSGATRTTRVGEFKLLWGESLLWDERLERLYFVDCAAQVLHWLESGEPPLGSLKMPGLPTGIVPTENGRLIVALDDGLYLVEPDAGAIDLLSTYPEGLGGRANDVSADFNGNLVTGTLGLVPGGGSYWWFSASGGWRMLADGIGNANGPVVLRGSDGADTLVFADTLEREIYAFDYDGTTGTARSQRVLASPDQLGGHPDGACADDDGAFWTCVLGAGKLARFTLTGPAETVDTGGVELPSDVTFGGPGLDRIFFVSIAIDFGGLTTRSPLAGALMVIDGSGHKGRIEPRFRE